jgi:hypothetical protein
VAGNTCDILDDALLRYYRYLVLEREAAYTSRVGYRRKSNELPLGVKHFNPKATFRGSLAALDVDLVNACEDLPYLGMDESCQ